MHRVWFAPTASGEEVDFAMRLRGYTPADDGCPPQRYWAPGAPPARQVRVCTDGPRPTHVDLASREEARGFDCFGCVCNGRVADACTQTPEPGAPRLSR